MPNDERSPKHECRKVLGGAVAVFVIQISSFFRISSFVIWICEAWFIESPLPLWRMHWDHEPIPSDRGGSPSAARGKRQTVATSPEFRKRAMCCEPRRFAVRFMESLHALSPRIGTRNLPGRGSPVRCPTFRRSGPAKAGTPNRRFMERAEKGGPSSLACMGAAWL
jgi:hypothetical protein